MAGLIANSAALAWLIYYLARRDHPLKFDRETLSDMRIDWGILLSVVKIGVPTGLQVMMVSLAEIAVITFVNHFGSSATAAYGAVNQVVGYVQFPAISIGIAASIFGAQCIGARREDKLGSVIRSAVGLNYAIGAVIIGACYIFAWNIFGWFITDRHTLEIAHQLLMITLWSLCDLRKLRRAQRPHARQRIGHLADGDRHLLDLGGRSSGRVLADAAHRPRRRLARLSDRVLHGTRAAVLLLRVLLEAPDARTPSLSA